MSFYLFIGGTSRRYRGQSPGISTIRLSRLPAVVLLWLAGALVAVAGPVEDEVAGLLGELDSDRFEVRERASARLAELTTNKATREQLVTQLQRVLLSSELPFEVRIRVEVLVARLPPVSLPSIDEVKPEELDTLISQLESDAYGVRRGASARLIWLLERPDLGCAIMLRLKDRLADPALATDARQQIRPIWEASRRAWLSSDPTTWQLPAVTQTQIDLWLDDLERAPATRSDVTPAAGALSPIRAEQELLDLLVRDDYLPTVAQAIENRLRRGNLNPEGERRLLALLDWKKPAMVAEYWQGGRHLHIQHLLVGVPSLAEGARRPSHFDAIDDQVAHCVSGNSLSEGDYPVGVFFPHPDAQRPDAQFHLVNLSTPRRRIAYDYLVKVNYVVTVDEAKRFAQTSERTLAHLAAKKKLLSRREIAMLEYLDATAVSRFAGPYFLAVDDFVEPSDSKEYAPGQLSRHADFCRVLAVRGDKRAGQGLLQAIKMHRFVPPSANASANVPWLALLMIAQREPWPEIDRDLASMIDTTEPLFDQRSEVGATAAAMLLERHQALPADFGLEPTGPLAVGEKDLVGYRFKSTEWRKKVLNWWEHEIESAAQPGSLK